MTQEEFDNLKIGDVVMYNDEGCLKRVQIISQEETEWWEDPNDEHVYLYFCDLKTKEIDGVFREFEGNHACLDFSWPEEEIKNRDQNIYCICGGPSITTGFINLIFQVCTICKKEKTQ